MTQTWRARHEEREGYDPCTVVDTRVAWDHRWGASSTQFYVEATNLLSTRYMQVKPIPMPGRWIIVGVRPT